VIGLEGAVAQGGCAAEQKIKRQTLTAGWPPKSMKMPAGGLAAAQGRRPTGFRQRALSEEFSRQKAKGKNF